MPLNIYLGAHINIRKYKYYCNMKCVCPHACCVFLCVSTCMCVCLFKGMEDEDRWKDGEKEGESKRSFLVKE